jgi:hypothetical protein
VNFLQLCKATARESGSIASLPSFTTVASASGRIEKLVAWVSDAWVQIQNERTDWLFRQAEFTHALVIGQKQYTGADLALTDLAAFLPDTGCRRIMSLYDPAIGAADEGYIQQVSYDEWRGCYNFGAQTNNRPVQWATAPDGRLCVGPAPDKAYVLRGRYRKAAQVLAADADVPIIPADFHGAIVGQALRNMIDSDEAYESLVPKAQKYEALRYPLVIAQTPQALRF